MKHFVLTLVISVGLWPIVFAQVHVEGVVTDTTDRPLSLANVLLMEGGNVAAFAASNADGRFFLEADPPASGRFYLRVSYLGYADYLDSFRVDAKTRRFSFHVRMQPLPIVLDEARVEYQVPLQIKDDTVVYEVDSFLRGDEQVLKDILKRLPGLEVSPNGEVFFLGKRVSKVLVEGEKFFAGDVKTAVENVPADVVDKIEVLNNYSDVGLMKNVVNQGEIALNVTLKKDKKAFWFGKIKAGGGVPRKYMTSASLYRYHPRRSFNILEMADNLDGSAFWGLTDFASRERYVIYTGNIPQQVGIRLRNDEQTAAQIFQWPGEVFRQRHAGGGASANLKTGPHLKWAFNGAFSDRRALSRTESDRIYLLGDSGLAEHRVDSTSFHRTNAGMVAGMEWKPAPHQQLNWQVAAVERRHLKTRRLISSPQDGTPYQALQPADGLRRRLFTTFDLFRMIKDHHIVALYLRHRYTASRTTDRIDFPDSTRWADHFPTPWHDSLIDQQRTHQDNEVQGMADYYYLWNEQFHLNLRIGGLRTHQTGAVGMWTADAVRRPPDARYYTDWTWTRQILFAGVGARRIQGRGTYSAALTAVGIGWKGQEKTAGDLQDPIAWMLLPNLSAEWELTRGRTIQLRYFTDMETPDAESLMPFLYYQSYQALHQGNPALTPDLNQTITFSFRRMTSRFSAYLNLSLTRAQKSIRSIPFYQGIERYVTFQNIDSDVYRAGWHSHIYRNWARWELSGFISLGGWYTWDWWAAEGTRQPTPWWQAYCNFNLVWERLHPVALAIDGQWSFYQAFSAVPQPPSLSGNVGPRLAVELHNGVRMDIHYFPHAVWTPNQTFRMYPNLEASISYEKEGSPWHFAIEGQNLLAQESRETFGGSEAMLFHTRRFLMGPYGVLTIRYRL